MIVYPDQYVHKNRERLKFFPSDQLGANLKCTECHLYLSISPVVVLKDTGEYKCGRCSLTYKDKKKNYTERPFVLKYKSAVRDLPYEELAKGLLFPCRNKNYGCEAHEEFPLERTNFYMHHGLCVKFQWCSLLESCRYGCWGCEGGTGLFSTIFEHCQSKHPEIIMCLSKWHAYTYIVTMPKDSKETVKRVLFLPSKQIMFTLFVVKIGREFTFTLKSAGTHRLFKFEIKPGAYKNNKRKGEILLSNPSMYVANPVKLVLQEQDEEPGEDHVFQMDFMGKVKQEIKELVKVPVEDSDVLRCVKCHRYLSVKPVVATKNGFECGCCFAKTEGDKVRMKAYETLAEMVLFPCEEPGCQESFGISEMKKHRDTHKLSRKPKIK